MFEKEAEEYINIIYPLGTTYYQYGDKTPNELFHETTWEYRGKIQGIPWWVRTK